MDSKALTTNQARFLRIRVEIPLNKPLRQGSLVISSEGDKALVAFKYERLVGLCYRCGMLGHEEKYCIVPLETAKREHPYGEWMKAGYRDSWGNMGRRPQGFRQQNEGNGRADHGKEPPQGAADSNSNSGIMVIYEKVEKSGINDEANKIPLDLEATPTETDLQLMMIDPTIVESEINEGNEISSGATNQGINLPSAPLNYGINDIPIGTETNATHHPPWPRDLPHDGILPMQPTCPQNQKNTRRKGLRKSETAKQEVLNVDRKIGLKREHRAWEDEAEPKNTKVKKAKFEM